MKKKWLNARRQGRQAPPAVQPQATLSAPQTALAPVTEPLSAAAELPREGAVLDEASVANSPMLPYVRMVVSLIAGVAFTCREVVYRLRQTLRQHSIGAGCGVDYLLSFLHRHPP